MHHCKASGGMGRNGRCVVVLVLLGSAVPHAQQDLPPKTAGAKPNLILFSIDDGIKESSWVATYQRTIRQAPRNPNGCRIPLTWFTASGIRGKKSGECAVALRARSKGHELATHTKSHLKGGDNRTYTEWLQEVKGQRRWLVDCGIPRREVVGFRAPYFLINEALGTVLRDLGFGYDSSLNPPDRNHTQPPYPLLGSGPSPANTSSNTSAAPECSASTGRCGNWTQLTGLWEVPTYLLPGSGGDAFRRVDPAPVLGMTVLQRLKADFDRKRGSGVPVSVMIHEPYLASRLTRQPIVDFFKWAIRQPNTWVVTYQQLLAYQKAGGNQTIGEVVAGYPCDR